MKMNELIKGEYIQFTPRSDLKGNRKTDIWDVDRHDKNMNLGQIRWYGAWRQYVFFPNDGTIFNKTCLREIADFCDKSTKEYMNKK